MTQNTTNTEAVNTVETKEVINNTSTEKVVTQLTPEAAVDLVQKANNLVKVEVKERLTEEMTRMQEIVDGQLSVTKQEAENQVAEIKRIAEAQVQAAQVDFDAKVAKATAENKNALKQAEIASQEAIRDALADADAVSVAETRLLVDNHDSAVKALEESRDRYKAKAEAKETEIDQLTESLAGKIITASFDDMVELLNEARECTEGWTKGRDIKIIDGMIEDLLTTVKPLIEKV